MTDTLSGAMMLGMLSERIVVWAFGALLFAVGVYSIVQSGPAFFAFPSDRSDRLAVPTPAEFRPMLER